MASAFAITSTKAMKILQAVGCFFKWYISNDIGRTIASRLDTYDNDWIGIYTGGKFGFYTM